MTINQKYYVFFYLFKKISFFDVSLTLIFNSLINLISKKGVSQGNDAIHL